MWMEYHNAQKCPWVLVFLFKSYMKTSQLLFLNAFSVKDAFSISDAFFLWIRTTLDVSLVRSEAVILFEFLVVSCCSAEPWARGLRGPRVWLRKRRHSQAVLLLSPRCISSNEVWCPSAPSLPLPRGRRSSCGTGTRCLPVRSPRTPACLLLSTSFHFNTRFAPTSQILLAMHNLNTFFFCIVQYTRCRFYRHESALFYVYQQQY